MHSIKKYFYALALCLSVVSCNKQGKPVDKSDEGNIVHLTVNVNLNCDDTKTELSFQNYTLKVNWSLGDILYVVGEDDGYLGYVTLADISEKTATFAGAFKYENVQKIRLYYFGKNGAPSALSYGDTEIELDFTNQKGTLDDIVDNFHIMGCITDEPLSMETDQQFVDVTIQNLMSVAIFNLTTQSAFDASRPVICKGAYSKGSIKLKTSEFEYDSSDKADMTLNNPSACYYLAMQPSSDPQTLTFSQSQTAGEYTGSIDIEMEPKTIAGGKIYSLNASGVPINVINALKIVRHTDDPDNCDIWFDIDHNSCPGLDLWVSDDGGINWKDIGSSTFYITQYKVNTIYVRGKNPTHFSNSPSSYAFIRCYPTDPSSSLTCEGNIMALVDWEHFNVEIPSAYYFYHLFQEAKITAAPSLSAAVLKPHCYEGMFENNSFITESPALPVEDVPDYAYANMFKHCALLETVNPISAVNLGQSSMAYMFAMDQYANAITALPELHSISNCSEASCEGMFEYCNKVTDASGVFENGQSIDLSAAPSCFEYMFRGCNKLLNTCKFPFKNNTLSDFACKGMFEGCTLLNQVEPLYASVMEESCYERMFYNCSSLLNAPELPSGTLDNNCYKEMFYNCTSLTKTPSLNASLLKPGCYYDMFNGCSSLTEATMMATGFDAENLTAVFGNWLYFVSSPGVFYYNKDTDITMWEPIVPSGWTKTPVQL